ncbi:GNAT family N-acetyltransferase [Micromonospora sp. WMMA1363]|uniref:GNAT family N-acetyltransferase n=1 Tax=Micromonospora sp. WMMA1363 TaxID=3053985 RepID=UPI00259C9191|nr:GNAT family N-acetyltransferase [Micromonospora sp. WMMA1363]MDM4719228.1 GNAT family N-acetyltransferase [Micromonospora sp. WMMA1363]
MGAPAVFGRDVAGFGRIELRAVDPGRDADLIHGWVSQERARFWGMRDAGRDRVAEIYRHVDSLPTHHAWLAYRNGMPAALFQTYEPAADPVGEVYDVQPGDHGVHLMIGPPVRPERGFTGQLLGVLVSFVFADPEHRRIIAEPDARNDRAVTRLRRTGFVDGPLVDLPDKQARLMFLDRPSRASADASHRRSAAVR